MAVYGNVTNRDLTGWGPKLMGGLVALIVCSLVGGLFSLFGFLASASWTLCSAPSVC